jgi:NADH dehydrogenase FAD-containing subunit
VLSLASLRGVLKEFSQAVDIVMSERLIEVETFPNKEGAAPARMYVPYDKLIIAVGSTQATHGVSGLEHCYQLKTVSDAIGIRRRIYGSCLSRSVSTPH